MLICEMSCAMKLLRCMAALLSAMGQRLPSNLVMGQQRSLPARNRCFLCCSSRPMMYLSSRGPLVLPKCIPVPFLHEQGAPCVSSGVLGV